MKTTMAIPARIRGVDAEIEATLLEDEVGPYTEVYVASTEDGYPMGRGVADGHLTEIDLIRIRRAMEAGRPTPGVTWDADEGEAVAA